MILKGQWEQSFELKMNQDHPGCLDKIETLPELGQEVAEKVLTKLLSYATGCSYVPGLTISQGYVRRIPEDWLRANLMETLVTKSLEIYTDDWAFRRTCELLQDLGFQQLLQTHLSKGLESSNPEIKECVTDWTD